MLVILLKPFFNAGNNFCRNLPPTISVKNSLDASYVACLSAVCLSIPCSVINKPSLANSNWGNCFSKDILSSILLSVKKPLLSNAASVTKTDPLTIFEDVSINKPFST